MSGGRSGLSGRIDGYWIERLKAWILSRIESGPGIRIARQNEKLVISAEYAGRMGAGGGGAVVWVPVLPPIPTAPRVTVSVVWATAEMLEGGTGDGQKWTTNTGWDRWRPETKYTTLSGVPVS